MTGVTDHSGFRIVLISGTVRHTEISMTTNSFSTVVVKMRATIFEQPMYVERHRDGYLSRIWIMCGYGYRLTRSIKALLTTLQTVWRAYQ